MHRSKKRDCFSDGNFQPIAAHRWGQFSEELGSFTVVFSSLTEAACQLGGSCFFSQRSTSLLLGLCMGDISEPLGCVTAGGSSREHRERQDSVFQTVTESASR